MSQSPLFTVLFYFMTCWHKHGLRLFLKTGTGDVHLIVKYRHFLAVDGGAEKHTEDWETRDVPSEEKQFLCLGYPYFLVSIFFKAVKWS